MPPLSGDSSPLTDEITDALTEDQRHETEKTDEI